MLQELLSAAVVIGALRVKKDKCIQLGAEPGIDNS